MATNCIDTMIFGQVCDSCDGGAIIKIVVFCFNLLTAGVLVLATIGIIILGVKLITARDNPDRVAQAKKRIIEIAIGIAAYALMYVVANFVVPGGVVMKTLDSSTSACTDAPAPPASPDPADPGDPSDPGSPDDPGDTDEPGKYPWATVVGTPSGGSIKCPHNEGFTYSANPNASNSQYDKFFQAKASSCPFTKVEYTKKTEDQACAPDNKMHYATVQNARRKNGSVVKETMGPFCLVNSKIDVGQYQNYLVENRISQDNRICMPDGECIDGGQNAPNGIKEYFACNYFSFTFAANINNGEVVSNDVLTSKCGTAFHAAYHRVTTQGNRATTWGGRNVTIYDDELTGITYDTSYFQPLPHGSQSTTYNIGQVLNALREGKAVTLQTAGVSDNGQDTWGHYITAIGFTKDCAINSGASCTFDDIVFLNSTYGSSIQVKYATLTHATTPDPHTQYECNQEKCKTKGNY